MITPLTEQLLQHVDDVEHQQIYNHACELIRQPEFLLGMFRQHYPDMKVDITDMANIAEYILNDDEEKLDRSVIDMMIVSTWKIAEYELDITYTQRTN